MARSRKEQPPAGLSELPGDPDSDFPSDAQPEVERLDGVDFEAAQGEDDQEKLALKAKVAELEAKLASRAVVDSEGGPSDYWKVELLHAPTHVVKARDAANAWEVYCKEMGVISSEYRPKAGPATREEYRAAQAKRHGKKPEEFELAD